MAKYISLIKYTAKGIEKVKESPKRLDAFKQLCDSTMGRYDLVLIVDAPNPETAAKVILTTTSGGAVSTETLTAFSEKEYRKIISELP
jgi:uncharacterized protein with GYD domain